MSVVRVAMFGLLLAAAGGGARADLINNGSFETPVVPVGGGLNFGGGSTAITGWTVTGFDVHLLNGATVASGITFNAHSGDQWLDLSGSSSNSTANGVTQDVATVAGQDYLLSFYVGSATDNVFFFPSTVDLSINGGARTSYTNPTAPSDQMNWLQFSTPFTATGAVTNLTFFNGGSSTNYLSGLDTVTLLAVPEPGSAALAGLAVLAVVWGGRRGRQ